MISERDKRMIIRGMSIARGILKVTSCDHHVVVRDYQEILADAWDFPFTNEALAIETAEYEATLVSINDAIAAKHPDWVNRSGQKWSKS